jgi:hypothetical protein
MSKKSPTWRAWIRTLPCCLCLDVTTVECAHVRYAEPRVGKPITGMGTKSGDDFVVPLCGRHHRAQHDFGNEREWWEALGIDPVYLALALKYVGQDPDKAFHIINAWANRDLGL